MYWLKIKRHGFANERPVITKTLISSCDWKIHVPFWLRKKRPEKAFSTLTVNYRKIVQKKQIMPFESTVNWLFTDIWCCLVTSWFYWSFVAFWQTVVRVYYILNIINQIQVLFKTNTPKRLYRKKVIIKVNTEKQKNRWL